MPKPMGCADTAAPTLLRAITRTAFRVLACAAGLAASASAPAQDHGSRDVGGWSVAESQDGDGCFLTKTYDRPGNTTVLLGLDRDGANHLSVLNANWSIRPNDRLTLDFRISKGEYARHFAVGMVADGKQGFVTSFEAKFPTYFAASRFLDISRGKVPVERLNLDGSGAAVVELRRCVAAQQAPPPAAGSKTHPDDIPLDPFASSKHTAKN